MWVLLKSALKVRLSRTKSSLGLDAAISLL